MIFLTYELQSTSKEHHVFVVSWELTSCYNVAMYYVYFCTRLETLNWKTTRKNRRQNMCIVGLLGYSNWMILLTKIISYMFSHYLLQNLTWVADQSSIFRPSHVVQCQILKYSWFILHFLDHLIIIYNTKFSKKYTPWGPALSIRLDKVLNVDFALYLLMMPISFPSITKNIFNGYYGFAEVAEVTEVEEVFQKISKIVSRASNSSRNSIKKFQKNFQKKLLQKKTSAKPEIRFCGSFSKTSKIVSRVSNSLRNWKKIIIFSKKKTSAKPEIRFCGSFLKNL